MKKHILIFSLVTAVSFTACTDILEDVEPATSISFETALSTPEAVRALRASMYSKIRAEFGFTTEYFIGPASLADLLYNRPGSTRFQNLNLAKGTDNGTAHMGAGGGYEILQEANLLIGGVADGVLPTDELNRYRGEAFAIRAMVFHRLATVYGYDPGTAGAASFDLSIMLRTEPTLDLAQAEPIARSTISETYAQILSDLAQAKTLLAGINADNGFVTEAYVEGLIARVSLYNRQWSNAVTAATNAITLSGRTLQSTADQVGTMFKKKNPESLFELVVDPNTEAIAGSNVNNGPVGYTSDQWVAQVPTNSLVGLYNEGDFRVAGWHNDCIAQQTVGATANGCATINALGVSLTKWNGWKGNLSQDLSYMRISEMYLILAEAAAKAANNPAAGLPYLNELRTARNAGDVPAAATASMTAFEDFILDERARELAGEGHRFFDLKRLERDVLDKDGEIKFRSDSYRILAPGGIDYQNINPLFVENPGYPTAGN